MRAGTGGDEASLWAADLVRMYQRYADTQGWKVSFLNASEAENGGFKEAVLQVCHATGFVLCFSDRCSTISAICKLFGSVLLRTQRH